MEEGERGVDTASLRGLDAIFGADCTRVVRMQCKYIGFLRGRSINSSHYEERTWLVRGRLRREVGI